MQNIKYLWAIPVLLFLVSTTARADQTWTYQGNSTEGITGGATNTCGCALSGTLTLDANFDILSYSFTDGIVTLNQTDSSMNLHPFLNGETVPFVFWGMGITAPDGSFLNSIFFDVGEATDSGTGGLDVEGNHGTWTESAVATPEPGTLALLGAGLVGVFARRRSKGILAA
jgi:hypothetical protein